MIEEIWTLPCSSPTSRTLLGYVARAPGPGRPALLVLHEVGGLNESMRAIARRLAAEGYVTLVPDLYTGTNRLRCLARLVGGTVLAPLRSSCLVELQAIVAALKASPHIAAGGVGVIGYSMGAGYALQLACVEPAIRAAVAFCGQNPRPLAAFRQACPILANYAERDLTTAGLARKLDRVLTHYGIPHDVRTYPGVRHAFYDPYSRTYDLAAAGDAWRRMMDFLRRYLREPTHERPGPTCDGNRARS